MPLTPCLSGPAFSITGDAYFGDNNVNFQVTFDQPSDHEHVLAYQWYLDGAILTEQRSATLTDKVSCGSHRLGLRILSNEGWSGIKTIPFVTCKLPALAMLYGADAVNEGRSSRYYVLQFFSDGSYEDVTSEYAFTSSGGGTFDSNTLRTLNDGASYKDLEVTLSALKSGAETLTKQIKILNTTQVTLLSLEISGPAEVNIDATARYRVIGHYSDGTQRDDSAGFVFASSEGYFTGSTYTASLNVMNTETRPVTINAFKNGFLKVSRQINVKAAKAHAGALVVDFYQNLMFNMIALVTNPEVADHHVRAYTGHNIIPATAAPENALILASDTAPSMGCRFVFNIDKLLTAYPGTSDFVMEIKGRVQNSTSVAGLYGVKGRDGKLRMEGSPGSYMPSVMGGKQLISSTPFINRMLGGANGNYDLNYLPTVVRFNYNVPTATLSYLTPAPPVEAADFDFMALSYEWGEGAGSDLDILVGFEHTGTSYDEVYVGYGQGNTLVPRGANPANTYLQWGTDNMGTNGYEGVLIGMKAFQEAFPNLPDVVEVGIYAVWYSTPVTGDFSLKLVTYKGGTMTHSGTDFVNTGGTGVSSDLVSVNTLKTAPNSMLTADYYKVGTLRYNKVTAVATIEIY